MWPFLFVSGLSGPDDWAKLDPIESPKNRHRHVLSWGTSWVYFHLRDDVKMQNDTSIHGYIIG